jgi:hypothetical protein
LVGRAGSANDVISDRGYWEGLPAAQSPQTAAAATNADTPPRPPAAVPVAVVASADSTGTVAPWPVREPAPAGTMALAYAAPDAPPAAAKPLPMGSATARPARAPVPAAQPDTTIVLKRSGDQPSVLAQPAPPVGSGVANLNDRFNSPWLRAMIVSPSAHNFMAATSMGETDYRSLAPYLRKPTTSVMMTFSADPHLGMTCEHFGGSAVVFVATVTFNTRTASLR